jgi:hypothetical protein
MLDDRAAKRRAEEAAGRGALPRNQLRAEPGADQCRGPRLPVTLLHYPDDPHRQETPLVRNEMRFSGYRRFETESRIQYAEPTE